MEEVDINEIHTRFYNNVKHICQHKGMKIGSLEENNGKYFLIDTIGSSCDQERNMFDDDIERVFSSEVYDDEEEEDDEHDYVLGQYKDIEMWFDKERL